MIQLTGLDGTEDRQYIFFSARRLEGFSVDNFHWMPTAKELGCRAYFLRDTGNQFYLRNSRPIIRLLRGVVRPFKGETIFVGSSMGAYAAIYYGLHCGADKVIAFTPAPPPSDKLPNILKKSKLLPEIEIHVGGKSKWKLTNELNDVQNALTFKDYATIIKHDTDMHNVAGHLRKTGELRGIISD